MAPEPDRSMSAPSREVFRESSDTSIINVETQVVNRGRAAKRWMSAFISSTVVVVLWYYCFLFYPTFSEIQIIMATV